VILLVDHRDSFVHNLARYFERLGQSTHVVPGDSIDVAAVRAIAPAAIILSPGPCTPREAVASLELVRSLHQPPPSRVIPMLGVCLGHQIIAEALGGRVVRAKRPLHGQSSEIRHEGQGIFADVPSPFLAGRYHSLIVESATLPANLCGTAWSEDGELMAFEHESLPTYGLQFHPESILTEHGFLLLANFLRRAGLEVTEDTASLSRGELHQPMVSSA
jgi:anthranilate synthase/aminodeoxychorismate synthase-like glutamine amidotransferase